MSKIKYLIPLAEKHQGAIIFIVTLFAIYWASVSEQLSQLSQQKQAIQILRQQIAENKELISKQAIMQRDFSIFKKQTVALLSAHSIDLMLNIIPAAELGGMVVQDIKPHFIRQVHHQTKHFLAVTGYAELDQLNGFISALSLYKFPLLLTRFSLHHRAKQTWHMMTKFVVIHHETTQIKSFSMVSRRTPKQWLIEFPLSQIFYVGLIQQNNSQWALLKLPNGKTFAVQSKSIVGTEKALIMAIMPDKIIAAHSAGLITISRYIKRGLNV